jgi:hypothetical protein
VFLTAKGKTQQCLLRFSKMNKSCFLTITLLLSACNTAPLALPQAQTTVNAQSSTRLFETFSGYLMRSSYDSLKLAEMGMQARSLLGKTYDNRNSASRYHLYYSGQSSSLAQANGPIRLGKDNILYLEHLTFTQGQSQRLYYRLGSFQALPTQANENQPVQFKLDKGVSLKMDWRGINPMDHDEIHLTIPNSVQPVPKQSTEFYS